MNFHRNGGKILWKAFPQVFKKISLIWKILGKNGEKYFREMGMFSRKSEWTKILTNIKNFIRSSKNLHVNF